MEEKELKQGQREERMIQCQIECRSEEDKMIVEGYAITFNSPATHYGLTEIIDRNALNGCDMKDVPLKYNHDDSHLILARTRNNSLQLVVDDKGLKIRAELINTTSNQDIYKMIQAGLLDKMSFAFTVSEENWDLTNDTRTILKIDRLYDVSVVDTPFYDTTSIYARALETLDGEKKKLDDLKEQQKINELKSELRKELEVQK